MNSSDPPSGIGSAPSGPPSEGDEAEDPGISWSFEEGAAEMEGGLYYIVQNHVENQ